MAHSIEVCPYYLMGKCKFGASCTKLHSASALVVRPKTAPAASHTGALTHASTTMTTTTVVVKKLVSASKLPSPSLTAETVLCFDTTGSMYGYLDETRKQAAELVRALVDVAQKNDAGLRLGVIAHGDYCDKEESYVIKYLPLLDAKDPPSVDRILAFIRTVGPTGGGDGPECYELALHKACNDMGWGKCSARTLVMVGDAEPHPVGYSVNGFQNRLDWRAELAALAKRRVRIFAVQAGGAGGETRAFWQALADASGGKRLAVSDISTIKDLIMAAVLRDLGDQAFEEFGAELRRRGAMRGEMKVVYEEIRTTSTRVVTSGDPQAAAAMLKSLSFGGGGGGGGGGGSSGMLALLPPPPPGTPTRARLPHPPAASGGAPDPASAPPKSKICRHWAKGNCTRGRKCSYAHGETDMKPA
jgi:hypothetical protein